MMDCSFHFGQSPDNGGNVATEQIREIQETMEKEVSIPSSRG